MLETIEFFLDRLKKWDNLYYNMGTTEVSDTEYDLLRSDFKKSYPNHPYFQEVGAPTNLKYEKISLPFVMGGLDKVDVSSVESWAKKENDDIVVSEKLDGNSIIASWINGELIFAASRGDGEDGQNILHKAKHFIPSISFQEKVTLRGEVLLEGDTFKALGFKNRRNGVTGILRKDEIVVENLKQLTCIFYELIEPELKTESERLKFIEETLKLRVPMWWVYSANEVEAIPVTLEDFLVKMKENADYDIDGLVLTSNKSKRENVKYPKSKVKFKVNEEAVRTKVLGIEWNVSRVGTIKPVVLIEPVEILGATISRCSGFNKEFIESNQIGIGAEIGIVRSGDVIPYITEVFQNGEVVIPTNCPTCQSVLRVTEKEIICDNKECPQRMIYNVSHFFIEIGSDQISDRTIEMIGVKTIEDMYKLKIENLEKLEGFGRKKAEIIINEVKKTLTVKPERLLSAFGMPLIGTTLSKSLCSKFSLDELFEIKDPEILGLGPITSKALIDNIGEYKSLYEFLKKEGLKFIEEDLTMKTLKGMKFALTGAGPLKRKEYEKLAEAKGAEIKGISKDTNFLVTDDISSNSEKIKSANKFSVKIITYTQFMDMLK